MFWSLRDSLKKIYTTFTTGIKSLYTRSTIDEQTLQELEKLLITADVGTAITKRLLKRVRTASNQEAMHGHDLKNILKQELTQCLQTHTAPPTPVQAYLLVGINGSGKTTCAAKLAYRLHQEGKRVLLVAGDTFRAAAVEQLSAWATKLAVPIVTGHHNQDPAAVVFNGCKRYKEEQYDVLIIDTAGRLQTKINLMRELEKIKRVITTNLPGAPLCTLLTVDTMLGQNSLVQARVFHEATHLDGIILTKMDGTGKGGIVFAIVDELRIPIMYISSGETLADFYPFKVNDCIALLLE